MTNEAIITQLQKKISRALMQAASTFVGEIIEFIPIYTGALRRDLVIAHDVEFSNGEASLKITQSPAGSDSEDYAAYQYFNSLRHAGTPEKKEPLPEVSGRATGTGDAAIYAARYKAADESGALKEMPAAEWFKKGIETPEIMKRVVNTFVNSVRQ